jgi:D-alanine-D-alanine ligase-like ATP-grasp enzyme
VLELAAAVPYLPRVGWDVVVTTDGMALLELNTHPGVETLQVHGPHLRDPRVRRFHERHL